MNSPAATVFVVDDELSVRQALLRLLHLAGLNGVGFASGQEFLERYAPSTPGCLVAAHLGTTEKTIKVHRARVMEKAKAGSLAELVTLAHRAGLLPS